MDNLSLPKYGRLFIGGAVAIMVWGVAGLIQMPRWGQGGYYTDATNVVTGVQEGGPAEEAGLQVGDRVVSIAGILAEGLPMQSRRPRPEPGESHTVVVERDGETVSTELVYGALSQDQEVARIVMAVVNLAFIGFGLWAFFTVNTSNAILFAMFGLTWGLASFEGPHLGSWEGVAGFVALSSGILCFVLLLHLFLNFPKTKRVLTHRVTTRLMYGAVVAFFAFGVAELLLHPLLYTAQGAVALVFGSVLLALFLVALLHSWLTSTRSERRDSGLRLVPLGIAIALAPYLLQFLVRVAASGFNLPGYTYYSLLEVVIPVTMALAVVKSARFASLQRAG
jgi:hypothetical protein